MSSLPGPADNTRRRVRLTYHMMYCRLVPLSARAVDGRRGLPRRGRAAGAAKTGRCLVQIFLILFALLMPRIVMVFIWIFTHWFREAYTTIVWPVLGFIFLPYTTLAYMAAMLARGDVTGGWILLIVGAVMVDVAWWGRGYRRRIHRRKAST